MNSEKQEVAVTIEEKTSKNESSSKNEYSIFYVCSFISILILLLGFITICIISIVYSYNYENLACFTDYNGISFGYTTWLRILGILSLCEIVFICIFIYFFIKDSTSDYLTCFKFINIMLYIFNFSWFIVGSVLYFKNVYPDCDSSSDIYKFGLAIFILQLIGTVCGLNAKNKNESE